MRVATFRYTNYRDDVAERRVYPLRMETASNDITNWGYAGYVEGQHLLGAYDLDKRAHRSFAMSKIIEWREREATPEEAKEIWSWNQAREKVMRSG